MAKEIEGTTLVCEYCNQEFGLIWFDWTIKTKCSVCSDGDEPCPECGIAPANDVSVKYVCKKCEMEHDIIISGEHI